MSIDTYAEQLESDVRGAIARGEWDAESLERNMRGVTEFLRTLSDSLSDESVEMLVTELRVFRKIWLEMVSG